MKDKNTNTRLSKFISLVLRHNPEAANISLDAHGWADVKELIEGINSTGRRIDMKTLEEIVANDEKQRYSFSDNKRLIRANQGHSVPIDLELEAAVPPEYLFHGTAARFIKSIKKEGLTPKDRLYVHLSKDGETAAKVGARHGKSVVLKIKAKALFESGQQFFLSANNVWLCKGVPPHYIIFPT